MTLLVTSVPTERSFSKLKLTQKQLRTVCTIDGGCLQNLMHLLFTCEPDINTNSQHLKWD